VKKKKRNQQKPELVATEEKSEIERWQLSRDKQKNDDGKKNSRFFNTHYLHMYRKKAFDGI
jgi:hypothetical protein